MAGRVSRVPIPRIRVAEQRALYDVTPRPHSGPPPGYYDAALGKQGQPLFDALRGIVMTGHNPLGYDQARDALFSLVDDTDGDDRLSDLYSGRVESGVNDRVTAYNHHFNTEHTWPQSLGAHGAAKSDLHQLQTADIEANNKRSSLPFGVVDPARVIWQTPHGPGPDDVSKLGYDTNGYMVFEPRRSERGNIARGLLYFETRYDGDRPPHYDPTSFRFELPTLLRWAKEDPVDDVERLRNDAVQALQGNRNPFVDHPDFVDLVGTAFEPKPGVPPERARPLIRRVDLTKRELRMRAAR